MKKFLEKLGEWDKALTYDPGESRDARDTEKVLAAWTRNFLAPLYRKLTTIEVLLWGIFFLACLIATTTIFGFIRSFEKESESYQESLTSLGRAREMGILPETILVQEPASED